MFIVSEKRSFGKQKQKNRFKNDKIEKNLSIFENPLAFCKLLVYNVKCLRFGFV